MTDESHEDHHVVTEIELAHAVAGMASIAHGYFTELVAAGFTEAQALELTRVWVASTLGARISP